MLADRWSRGGVLVVSYLAMAAASLVGGLSQDVGIYLISAVLLGVVLAMHSGTVDAMVYDVLVEETGSGQDFARHIGRVRLLEAVGLTTGALAGGLVAELTTARTSYLLTVPVVLLAVVVRAFREPVLHRQEHRTTLRDQLRSTVRAMNDRAAVIPAMALGAAAGVALQLVLEFGPLWLVDLAAPVWLYGPYTALATAALSVGGLLAAAVIDRTRRVVDLAALLVPVAVTAPIAADLVTVVLGQAALIAGLALIGVLASQRLHEATQSSVRASVASAAGTLTWLTFVPA